MSGPQRKSKNGQGRRSKADRERAKFRQDILLLSGVVGGFLCAAIGLVLGIIFPTSSIYGAMTAAGVLVAVVSGAVIHWQRYRCPECGGQLKPIARPEDRRAITFENGELRNEKVSQFYDCNVCGHREWIEHE